MNAEFEIDNHVHIIGYQCQIWCCSLCLLMLTLKSVELIPLVSVSLILVFCIHSFILCLLLKVRTNNLKLFEY